MTKHISVLMIAAFLLSGCLLQANPNYQPEQNKLAAANTPESQQAYHLGEQCGAVLLVIGPICLILSALIRKGIIGLIANIIAALFVILLLVA